jgi:hypothetical protein
MDLNEKCETQYRISSWPRWDYDLDAGTLVFSESGVPKVVATIQAVGSTSESSTTWKWGWAHASFPPRVTDQLERVREFGEVEGLQKLTQELLTDDEYLGWELTAVAAKILEAPGAYRCPVDNGFLYFVYTSLQFANESLTINPRTPIACSNHGQGFSTYVCEHLIANPAQEWLSNKPVESNPWPDAWCALCDEVFQEQGEWNDKNEGRVKIKVLCHRCYEAARGQNEFLMSDAE